MHYRIFIDEAGDHSSATTNMPLRRFLGITGVIMPSLHHDGDFARQFDALREAHFGRRDTGHLVHLHRREMVRCTGSFHCLNDPERRRAWESDFLSFLMDSDFHVITACIDKVAFYYRYPNWCDEPYHLCFFNALERFYYFLRDMKGTGDVVTESRNSGRDKALANAYTDFWTKGTRIAAKSIQERFLSQEIAFVTKVDDVPGVQIADLVGKPAFSACRRIYRGEDEFTPYSREIARVIEKHKFYRRDGKIDGHGRLWRPRN